VSWVSKAAAGHWRKQVCNYAGQASKPFVTFEKDGIKYGFVAFAPNTGCNNINDLQAARKMVAYLDSIADIVIVSFHGGAGGPTTSACPSQE